MPQRRPYGAMGMPDGQQGAKPAMAMPGTGTGTTGADQFLPQSSVTDGGVDPMAEDPNTTRRRLMPIAGPMGKSTDALAVMQQALADGNDSEPDQDMDDLMPRRVSPWGSY